jgi:hypothetical protein
MVLGSPKPKARADSLQQAVYAVTLAETGTLVGAPFQLINTMYLQYFASADATVFAQRINITR